MLLSKVIQRPTVVLDFGTTTNSVSPNIFVDEITDVAIARIVPGAGYEDIRYQKFDKNKTFPDFFDTLLWHIGPNYDLMGCNIVGFDLLHITVKTGRNLIAEGVRCFDIQRVDMAIRKNGKRPVPRSLLDMYMDYIGDDFDAHKSVEDVKATIKVAEAMFQRGDLTYTLGADNMANLHAMSMGLPQQQKEEGGAFDDLDTKPLLMDVDDIQPIVIPRGIRKKSVSTRLFGETGENMWMRGPKTKKKAQEHGLPDTLVSHIAHPDVSVGARWCEILLFDVINGHQGGEDKVTSKGLENFQLHVAYHIDRIPESKRRKFFQELWPWIMHGDFVPHKKEFIRPIMRAFGCDVGMGGTIVSWSPDGRLAA